MEDEPPLRVMALHALAYCERLFYLEEVEEIRRADAAVYDGRREHQVLAPEEGITTFVLEAPALGLKGKVDALRNEHGSLVPVETKRGKSAPGEGTERAWNTDRIQVGAYALLVEEALGGRVSEAKIRYLADHRTVTLPVDDPLRDDVRRAIARAQELRRTCERPPVASNERLCVRCSLAPICLPEEDRFAHGAQRPVRLFPEHEDRTTLHIAEDGATVGRAAERLVVRFRQAESQEQPIRQLDGVVLHGNVQITTQALRLCASHDVAVSWMSRHGEAWGALASASWSAQRHVRQFRAFEDLGIRLRLMRTLVTAKVESQLRFLLRATRGEPRSEGVLRSIAALRSGLSRIQRSEARDETLGLEGAAAAAYFTSVSDIQSDRVPDALRFTGRNRHPSHDRINALLNYGYGLLYRQCLAACLSVGLHPGLGFYHEPRSGSHALALDLMELFRVAMVDMPVIGAVNRGTFDAQRDFEAIGASVWLAPAGRERMIEIWEERKRDTWHHPVLRYSLSYGRMIELEARLLEKEWTGSPGLFGRARLR